MRAEFEYWASDSGAWPAAAARSGDGYRLMQTHQQWLAWQAGYSAALRSQWPAAADESGDTI